MSTLEDVQCIGDIMTPVRDMTTLEGTPRGYHQCIVGYHDSHGRVI